MCTNCSVTKKKFWVFGCGTFFLLIGLIVGLLWPTISLNMLQSKLVLNNGSTSYNSWIETPIPMYFSIKMFNWTNPEQIHDRTVKPNFVEMGPYVFVEKHKRVDVGWNDSNGTVSYNQIRTWHFVPELSKGSLNDTVTNINVMSTSAGYNIRHASRIIKLVGNQLINKHGGLVVTKTVRELLFDGYDDELLDVLKQLNTSKIHIPFDKFGWFVDRNGSKTYDGHFEIYTGQQDITKMGSLTAWNYRNKTNYYHGHCSDVTGSSGELWPMNINATGDISVFVTDICRPLTLAYKEEIDFSGITASKWVGDDRVFDNGIKYPPNYCYCTGDKSSCPDLLPGVQNISDCRFGAPVFVSFPHFYLGDPSYVNAVSGLAPNKNLHEFSLAIEPLTGIPVNVNAKLQINILLQPVKDITLYQNVPKVMIPTFWFEQTIELNEELTRQAWMAAQLPSIGIYGAIGVFTLGIILIVVGLVATLTKSWNNYADLDNELNT